MQAGRYNGAYYYSQEICRNIIPYVQTDRNWVTINIPGTAKSHSIVFIHNNIEPRIYDWMKAYKDLVLVCGIPETTTKVAHLGTAIYLPLSVDVEEVKQYRVAEKTKDTAFAGRPAKRHGLDIGDADILEGMPRPKLLEEMAKYRNIYAVGRTAIEAKVLGCNILPYDPRFPDPKRWKVYDNKQCAKLLQKELDEIDWRYSNAKGGTSKQPGKSIEGASI